MSTGEQPATSLPAESGWTQGSTDHLIELAHGLLSCIAGNPAQEDPVPGWGEAYTQFEQLYHRWIAREAQETCHRCGGDFTPWTAPSPLWNEVMRSGDIDNVAAEPYRGIVCPNCFMVLAEKAGVATGWRLYAATVFRHLQTVTPTGRVWNPETWLFDDPAPTAGQATS